MAKQNLRTLISDSQKQRKRRAKKKQMIAELADKSPTNAAKLQKFMNESPGQQPLENLWTDLHQAIINLVTVGAGADLPSQTDVLNSCKTLDDLHAALQKEGYVFSRQALYLRLIPRRADSQEGKCHVRTVPVKLCKAKNTLGVGMLTLVLHLQSKGKCVILYLYFNLIMPWFCQ